MPAGDAAGVRHVDDLAGHGRAPGGWLACGHDGDPRDPNRCRRPAPGLADPAPAQPAGPRLPGGGVDAAPELRRDRAVASEPELPAAPLGAPRRAAAGP